MKYEEKADLHMHTSASDGMHSGMTMAKIANRRDISIAIADHNHIKGNIDAAKNRLGVTVVPGIEVTTREGPHILFYFYKHADLQLFFRRYIRPNHRKAFTSNLKIGTMKLISAARKLNGLIVPAHPFSPGFSGSYLQFGDNPEFIQSSSAVEVLNSAVSSSMNQKAKAWADSLEKPGIGSTDSHCCWNIGKAYTLLQDSSSVEAILESIRNGAVRASGREFTIREHSIDGITKAGPWLSHPAYFIAKGLGDAFRAKRMNGQD